MANPTNKPRFWDKWFKPSGGPVSEGTSAEDPKPKDQIARDPDDEEAAALAMDIPEIDIPEFDEVNDSLEKLGMGLDAADLEEASESAGSARNAVFYLMVLSAFTKVFGFVREILLANYYGVGEVAEAYKIAQAIPMIILMIVGTGLSTGFIPAYNKADAKSGEKSADRFTSNIMNIVVIFALIFCIIVNLFPNLFVKLFASGFEGEKLAITAMFTRVAVFGTVFSMMSYILQPYLNIKENFWVPAMVGIPMNLVFFASYPLAKNINIMILPIGIVVSVLVQVVWMWPFAKKEGFHYKPVVDFKDPSLRHLLLLAAPVILGVAVNQINMIVDKNMASWVIDGGVAALDYASRMNGFVEGIFIYSVIAVVYPRISKMVIAKQYKGVEATMTNSLVTITLVVVPCIIGLMVFSEPIIRLLFFRGEFDERAVAMTAGGMFWYAPGLMGFGIRGVVSRVFYSMDDAKTPTINAAIAVGVNIVLNIILSMVMGLNGLALATSIASILGSILLMISLRKKGNLKFEYKELLIKILKITGASVVMGIVAYAAYILLSYLVDYRIGLILAIGVAVVVYAGIVLLLKIPEVDEAVAMIRAKLKK